jgi:hypothetical protein
MPDGGFGSLLIRIPSHNWLGDEVRPNRVRHGPILQGKRASDETGQIEGQEATVTWQDCLNHVHALEVPLSILVPVDGEELEAWHLSQSRMWGPESDGG